MSSNIEIKKKCKWCSQIYIVHKTTTNYCSHRCNNAAYKERIRQERIATYQKEYLTLDEVKQLAATPCDIPVLKAASLFACLTGLRISDIFNLQWEDFAIAPDQGYCLRIRTQKTQTEATLPINYEAYKLCVTPDTGKVFKGLNPNRSLGFGIICPSKNPISQQNTRYSVPTLWLKRNGHRKKN